VGVTYLTFVIKLKYRKRRCGHLTGHYRPTQERNIPCSTSNRKHNFYNKFPKDFPKSPFSRLSRVQIHFLLLLPLNGFGGLELACWPLVPKFAGSHPAEAFGFLRAKKSSARLPSEEKYSRLSHVVALRHVKDP
jgi:hypothetical protein